jgi:hypothetical protein
VAAHGAHVHKGINAINRLRVALDRVKDLERLPVEMPAAVKDAIAAAAPICCDGEPTSRYQQQGRAPLRPGDL